MDVWASLPAVFVVLTLRSTGSTCSGGTSASLDVMLGCMAGRLAGAGTLSSTGGTVPPSSLTPTRLYVVCSVAAAVVLVLRRGTALGEGGWVVPGQINSVHSSLTTCHRFIKYSLIQRRHW